MGEPRRADDRWLTPGVVIAALFFGTVMVLGVVLAVTYLTTRGLDPQPVVQLAGTAVAALAAVGTFIQNLATRRTTTKVERNTGVLASGVATVVDELDAARYGDHSYPAAPAPQPAQEGLGGVPAPVTAPHPFYSRLRPPPVPGQGAAPTANGR